MQNNVEVIYKLLKSFEVTTAAALAEQLGVGESAVSSWKKRGVPAKILLKAATLTGKSVGWFTGDEGEEVEIKKPLDDIQGLAWSVFEKEFDQQQSDEDRMALVGDLMNFLAKRRKER